MIGRTGVVQFPTDSYLISGRGWTLWVKKLVGSHCATISSWTFIPLFVLFKRNEFSTLRF